MNATANLIWLTTPVLGITVVANARLSLEVLRKVLRAAKYAIIPFLHARRFAAEVSTRTVDVLRSDDLMEPRIRSFVWDFNRDEHVHR